MEADLVDNRLGVTITAIGIDECAFIEGASGALTGLIKRVYDVDVKVAEEEAKNTITGEPLEAVSVPRAGDEGVHSVAEPLPMESEADEGKRDA